MKIQKSKLESILNNLADLVEFYEEQTAEGMTDGAIGPKMSTHRAIEILDEMTPGWRESICVIQV